MTQPIAPDAQRAWAFVAPAPRRLNWSGPLADLTFSIKDLYGVPGWPLSASTRAPVPDPGESVLVRRLLELGAVALGKTHLHEVALGITGMNGFGGTLHPFLPERIPGGSSSGAAVSVALKQVDFALGTDTGGSIRVPSAWCGVVGFKPTKGDADWSTAGVLPLSWTCDHAGPLARDIKTIVRLQEALTGRQISAQSWAGVRVGLWLPDDWVDDPVREATNAFAARLQALGADISLIHLPDMLDAYTPIVLSEAAQVHAQALEFADPGFLPFTLNALQQGAALTPAEVQRAFEKRVDDRDLLAGYFTAFDVILAPAVPTPPPLFGQEEVEIGEGTIPLRKAVLRLTAPFSLLGVPAVAYPTSTRPTSTDPTPTEFVGVQVVAPWGEDDHLLGLLLGLEE